MCPLVLIKAFQVRSGGKSQPAHSPFKANSGAPISYVCFMALYQ
jgi:hypothetical protein